MLLALMTSLALTTATQADWPMYRRDYRNSGSVPGPAHAARVSLQRRWRFLADSRVTSTPTIAGGIVYAGTWKGGVVALDERDGHLLWRASLGAGPYWYYGGPRGVIGSIAVADGVAYAVSGACEAGAFDARTGRERWRTKICDTSKNDDTYASPVVVDGKVLLGIDVIVDLPTDRGREIALDARTGRLAWTLYPQLYAGTGAGISATPAVDAARGLAYIGTGNPTPMRDPPPGPDAYADSLLAVDVGSGQIEWTFGPVNPHDTHDFDFFASPNRFVGGGRRLVGEANKNGTYYALDERTGREVWRTAVMPEIIGTPAVKGDTVYVTAYADSAAIGGIAALRASDGRVMWMRERSGMYESPTPWGNVVFATEVGGWLDAFAGGTGMLLGRWNVGGPLRGRGPSIADGKLFIAARDSLIAFELSP